MKKFFYGFIFFGVINIYANQNNDFVITPSTYNSIYMVDDSPYVGQVFDMDNGYKGTYIRPVFEIEDDVKKYYQYILFSALMQKSAALSDEAESNFKITLGVREDVVNAIDNMEIANQLIGYIGDINGGDIKVIVRSLVDNMFFIINESLECDDPNFSRTSSQQVMCNVLNSPITDYIKGSSYAVLDAIWEHGTKEISKTLFTKISVDIIGKVCFTLDSTLSFGKSLTDLTAAWSIENNVINKYYISMMINDFHAAYVHFNQDIDLLRDFLVEKTQHYNYGGQIMGAPRITKENLRSFLDVFFHYVQLRKTTDFGYYNFSVEREIKSHASKLKDVNMKVAPAASAIMLELIELYGNGGNFRTTVSPSYERNFQYSLASTNETKVNELYTMPESKNVTTFKNGEVYTFLTISGMGPSDKVKGTCSIDELPIIVSQPTLSVNGMEPLVSNSSIYNVSIGGQMSQKYLHELNYKIVCKYKYESQVFNIDTTWKQEHEIRSIFVPEVLSDIRGSWAKDYIKNFYTAGFIRGYDDGYFHGDRNITNGQFLAVATNSILGSKLKDEISNTKDENQITFSKYVKVLKSFGVNIELLDGNNISNFSAGILDSPASRGYVAKVLSNILLASKNQQQLKNCSIKTTYPDWDECSDYLRKTCISQGSETYEGSKVYQYKPEQNIRRDEAVVLIYKALETDQQINLCSIKRIVK